MVAKHRQGNKKKNVSLQKENGCLSGTCLLVKSILCKGPLMINYPERLPSTLLCIACWSPAPAAQQSEGSTLGLTHRKAKPRQAFKRCTVETAQQLPERP
ncbi:unnamed protein product [Polarella glacialis]|uniref:Uncharacterized protein n=1 Tax=Polarella glacialis TaxID=89957 RepID=A0A813JSQ0_POLGL|nr:unnamed protein product [Polarella glacialis]